MLFLYNMAKGGFDKRFVLSKPPFAIKAAFCKCVNLAKSVFNRVDKIFKIC